MEDIVVKGKKSGGRGANVAVWVSEEEAFTQFVGPAVWNAQGGAARAQLSSDLRRPRSR
jgi:hypothetical protein